MRLGKWNLCSWEGGQGDTGCGMGEEGVGLHLSRPWSPSSHREASTCHQSELACGLRVHFFGVCLRGGGRGTALFKMHIWSPYAPVPTSGPGAPQRSIPVPHMSPFSPLPLSSSHPELFQVASVCYSPHFSLPLSLSPSLLVRVNHLL